MIFKVFPARELATLYNLLADRPIVGPVRKATNKDGEAIFDFQLTSSFSDLVLDYDQTVHSAKQYFLPHREDLCTFTVSEDGWQKHVDFGAYNQTVFFGLHPCDINALNKLDKVLMESAYPNPFYGAKRARMFIVGHSCQPMPSCFCRSMGTDSAIRGFDLFLTRLDEESYFAEINSPAAHHLLEKINSEPARASDHKRFRLQVAAKNRRISAQVDTTDLTKILDMEFHADVWQEWGDKCLSCGTCANVCPTCYCYGVEEEVDLDLAGARKEKLLYSCNLVDFAQVAGGHNFRPESHSRLKYRYYHKHRGFVEAYEESLCVGCGRCGNACLADINVPEVIASVRGEEDA
ncbi:MAG: 4Fe-4S dicluster domain-containing protein [Thermodesulfobacteriota bacterium]